MAQCEEYPNSCSGRVSKDDIDGKWYCKKHFYMLKHLKDTGRK